MIPGAHFSCVTVVDMQAPVDCAGTDKAARPDEIVSFNKKPV